VATAIKNKEYDKALQLRGADFMNALSTLMTLTRSAPHKIAENIATVCAVPFIYIYKLSSPHLASSLGIWMCVKERRN
jgi:hypothetical protein